MSPTSTEQTSTEAASTPAVDGATNRWLVAAGVLGLFTVIVHIFGGGASIVEPLLNSPLADEPRLVLLAVWHMATVAMGVSALAFLVVARPKWVATRRPLTLMMSALWIGFGLCFVAVALFEGGNLITTLNQPILLIPVGLAGLMGSK